MAKFKDKTPQLLQDLIEAIDDLDVLLTGLLAINVANLKTTQSEKISILDAAGLNVSTIADVLGTSANSVAVALHSIRKRKKSGRRGAKRQKKSRP